MVNANFKDLALSFSGMDGGNIQSEVWFCGLEHGIGGNFTSEMSAKEKPVSEDNIYSWDHSEYDGGWNAPYNQRVCWFMDYFYQLDLSENSYEDFVKAHKILFKEGMGFKANMFPIRFSGRDNINWSSELVELTGFSTFIEYENWCVEHRGKFFRQYVEKYSPKVIVCTGITHDYNFIKFFTGQESFKRFPDRPNPSKKYRISYNYIGNTLVCVVPFFRKMPNCIDSPEKMESLVKDIKSLLK